MTEVEQAAHDIHAAFESQWGDGTDEWNRWPSGPRPENIRYLRVAEELLKKYQRRPAAKLKATTHHEPAKE